MEALAQAPPTVPQPMPGEQYEQYVVRAHRDLMVAIPEPSDRNAAVWGAWEAANGDSERERAAAAFPSERYDCRQDVCHFMEHQTTKTGPDGQPMVKKYGVNELVGILRNNNGRIADTDAYSTIIDRHTAAPGQPEIEKPKTLGYAGPYRLGMIGRTNPRFGLFTDEYTRKDSASQLADNPGRSVEVLTMRSTGQSYINPIAAISEAPRLPLPLQYSVYESEEGEVERYSVSVPVAPGGGNTFIRKFEATNPESQEPNTPEEGQTMLTDEDLKRVVQAVTSLPAFQWAMQQAEQAQNDPAAGGEQMQPQMQPQGPPPGADPGQPPAQPQPNADPTKKDEYMGQQYMGGQSQSPQMNPRPSMQFSADVGNEDHEALVEKFQAIADERAELYSALNETNQRIVELERDRSDASRRERLQSLQSRFPHAVDLDYEHGRCLYSMGSSMDDESFEEHCTDVEKYAAQQMPTTQMVPSGEMPQKPGNDLETAKYAAQESEVVKSLINQYAGQGIVKTLPELKAEARQTLQPQ